MSGSGARTDLAALCRAAESEAGRWGDPRRVARTGPPVAVPGRRVRTAALAALAAACGLAAVLVAAHVLEEPAPVARHAAAEPAFVPGFGASPFAAGAPAVEPSAPEALPPHREGRELVVAFDAVPLSAAIGALAQSTGTAVLGIEHVRDPAAVTLRARSADVQAVWKRLLADRVAFSVACTDGGCNVWITSGTPLNVVGAAAFAPGAHGADATRTAVPAPAASVDERTPGEIASQPDGSC